MSFFLYGNPFNFSHIVITMTHESVAFCIMVAFAVFAASAKKAKAKADKAKNDEIANLKTELDDIRTRYQTQFNLLVDILYKVDAMYKTELAEANGQHRTEVDDIRTRRQTQYIQIVESLYKLDALHKTNLMDTLRRYLRA